MRRYVALLRRRSGVLCQIDLQLIIKVEYATLLDMKNIIQFFVSNKDSTIRPKALIFPIVTEGKTFEELMTNILDAVKLFFKGEDSASLGFGPMPSILTKFRTPCKSLWEQSLRLYPEGMSSKY